MRYKLVYISCKNQKEAQKIGQALVVDKLAVCVNIIPNIKSIFRWKGKIEKVHESLLLAKTIEKNLAKLINKVKKLHSYKVPCIISLEITSGLKNFLRWIDNSLK